MIIQLTTHCSEGCTHCFGNCIPDNSHMSWDTLKSVITYIKNMPIAEMEMFTGAKMGIRPVNIVVSGGEPTEHPSYDDMVVYIANELDYCNIILESNGQWFYSEDGKNRMKKVLELNQVGMVLNSTDHRYYPNYNKFMLHKDDMVEFGKSIAIENTPEDKRDTFIKNKIVINADMSDHFETVRLGRAKDFKEVKNPTPKVPNCIQLIYMAQEQKDLSSILVALEHRGLYTSPIFGIDGTIYPGYCHLCQKIGHVNDTDYDALYTYLKMKAEPCGACQLNHRIPESVSMTIHQHRKLTLLTK